MLYDLLIIGAGPAGSTAAKLAADRGYHVLLVDKARFPRHKTCASWVNRLAFERFPYLEAERASLVDAAFYGIEFWDSTLARSARYEERQPSGYLTLRHKFDDGLRKIALAAGAEMREGAGIQELIEHSDRVEVRLDNGESFAGKVLLGADGASSRVAVLAGFRKGWAENQFVLAANEDIPCSPALIDKFFGSRFPIYVGLRFRELVGYGWVFPKREHVCVGIGGRLGPGEKIQEWYSRFLEAVQSRGLAPAELARPGGLGSRDVHYAVDPAGAVNKVETLVRGRVLLIGDAGGFVSGATGEGIYPAMESARAAVDVVDRGLRDGQLPERLAAFNLAWRKVLGGYLRNLPGGERREQTHSRVDMIFRSRVVCGVAARVFLYGEPIRLGTLWRALRAG